MTYDLRMWDQQGLRSSRNITCLRRSRLVYARTLKCGSEFFWRNFRDVGWQEIAWQDINWENNHVFSFIMDPIQRRHKGMAEWVIYNDFREQVMQDPAFQRMINSAPSLDEHSACLRDLYGARMVDIDWLPMTEDHAVAIGLADQLLARAGHAPIQWKTSGEHPDYGYTDYVHSSQEYMEDLYQMIKHLWDSNAVQDSNHYYFEQDILAWRRACLKYNVTQELLP